MTPKGVEEFIEWTRDSDGYDWAPTKQYTNAEVAINRFLDEITSAQQTQGKDYGLKDWWAKEPPLPKSWRRNFARELAEEIKSAQEMIGEEGGETGGGEPSGELLAVDVHKADKEAPTGDNREGSWMSELVFRHAPKKEDGERDEHGGRSIDE